LIIEGLQEINSSKASKKKHICTVLFLLTCVFLSINTETLLEASRDVGLEINAKKTKYMIMSHHQNSGQNQNLRIANESFENVVKFKYLRMTLTNQNYIHDEIKSRLNLGNAYYYSVQNLLSSCLISKNLKIKTHKTVILPIVLYGCEIWSLTLREEHRLRVFENRV
jgi:hypothetical protein